MTDIPVWVYLLAFGVAGAAAVGPSFVRIVQAGVPPVRHVPEPAAKTYSRAAWINQLCDLTVEAEKSGQADVATAGRALIAALVAVREKTT